MSHELTVIWVVAVGAQLAIQAPINSGLGRTVGKLPAALISFFVGLGLLLVICVAAGELGRLDWLTLVFALLASTVLFAGGSQLMRNRAAISSWRKPRD